MWLFSLSLSRSADADAAVTAISLTRSFCSPTQRRRREQKQITKKGAQLFRYFRVQQFAEIVPLRVYFHLQFTFNWCETSIRNGFTVCVSALVGLPSSSSF